MSNNQKNYSDVLVWEKPAACAFIKGSPEHPDLQGTVLFYSVPGGVLVRTELFGLPMGENSWGGRVMGFHIHEGQSCSGTVGQPFVDTGGHYNPTEEDHPSHAGDLLPVFGNNGYAWQAQVTNRFDVADILGRTVVLHSEPDDFRTQPSGDSGNPIACGVIRRVF